MSIGIIPEIISQQILVGTILVGGFGRSSGPPGGAETTQHRRVPRDQREARVHISLIQLYISV